MKKLTPNVLALVLSCSLATVALTGCSSTKTTSTVTREETVPAPSSSPSDAAAAKPGTVVTEKTETVTTSDSGVGCSGVLSCTFHALGWVIALPFKAVGGVIELIF